jgi:hypothetical protein
VIKIKYKITKKLKKEYKMENIQEKLKEIVEFVKENKADLLTNSYDLESMDFYAFDGIYFKHVKEEDQFVLFEYDEPIATVLSDYRTTFNYDNKSDVARFEELYTSFKLEKEIFLSEKAESSIPFLEQKIEDETEKLIKKNKKPKTFIK